MRVRNPIPPVEPSYTPDEFCISERISKVSLYAMWKQGKGPRYYMNGKCRRIPHSARIEWQERMMAEACGGANDAAA
jgi:hypothetical protein